MTRRNMTDLNKVGAMLLAVCATAVFSGCASEPKTAETQPSESKQKSAGDYIDDAVVTTRVKAAIFNDPTLKASEINVETYKGVVQLSGFVLSEADRTRAAQVAREVKGVESVKNDIRLK